MFVIFYFYHNPLHAAMAAEWCPAMRDVVDRDLENESDVDLVTRESQYPRELRPQTG